MNKLIQYGPDPDPEASAIVLKLKECSGPDDALQLIHDTFLSWFNYQVVEDIETFEPLANDIWEIWARYRKGFMLI